MAVKLYHLAKYSHKIHIPSSISRPSKIYPNWDFWFENMPSGNTGFNWFQLRQKIVLKRSLVKTRAIGRFRVAMLQTQTLPSSYIHSFIPTRPRRQVCSCKRKNRDYIFLVGFFSGREEAFDLQLLPHQLVLIKIMNLNFFRENILQKYNTEPWKRTTVSSYIR
jgi:hypothetical protein